MSQSPTATGANGSEPPNKRRRTDAGPVSTAPPPDSVSAQGSHIPKRGARACTNCRKGKNRCEGEVRALCGSLRPATDEARHPDPARLTRLPSPPASVVKRVERPASLKSQKRKMSRRLRGLALSESPRSLCGEPDPTVCF